MSSSLYSSPRSDLADTRLLSYLWTARPLPLSSLAHNGTLIFASTLDSNPSGAQAFSTLTSSSRLVLFAQASPLVLTTAFLLAALLRLLSSSCTRQKGSPAPASTFVSYFAPFVSDEDARQHRLESALPTQQTLDRVDHASDSTLTSVSSAGVEGYRRQRGRLHRLLLVSLIEAVATAAILGWTATSDGILSAVPLLSRDGAWIYILFRVLISRPQTPSFDLAALLFLLNITAAIDLFSFLPLISAHSKHSSGICRTALALSITNLVFSIYAASLCLRMPVVSGGYEAVVDIDERVRQQADSTAKPSEEDHCMATVYRLCPTSPEDYCSLYENLSYSWMAPIQRLALKRSLRPTDVWRLRSVNDTRLLFRKFEQLKLTQLATGHQPRLLSRILRANANDILLDACFKLISVSFAYLGTYILKSILDQIQVAASMEEDQQSEHRDLASANVWTPRQKAFVYACIGLALTVTRFLAELQNYHHARQVGLRIRSTLVVSLFEKALKRRDLSGQTKAAPPTNASSSDAGLYSLDHAPSLISSHSASGSEAEPEDALTERDQHLRPPPHQGHVRQKRSWKDSLRIDKLKQISFESLRSTRTRTTSRHQASKLKQREEEQGADVGKIVNMMASDVNILLRMGCDLHQLYGAPLEVTIAAIFLYKLMGWSALVGFSILVAAIPVNYYWGEIAVKKQREYSSARDERMSLMTELIDAMRFVKVQGVESQWEQRVASARRKEIRKLIWSRVMTFLFELLWTVIPVLVTLVSFFFYVKVAKEELTVSTAFTAIALFTMIRPPLNAIPGFLMGGLIAMVSVQRLESFLDEQEVEEAVSQLSRARNSTHNTDAPESVQQQVGRPQPDDSVLKIEGCSFHWHTSKNTPSAQDIVGSPLQDLPNLSFSLRDISVSFPAAKLTLIVGPTGSGKSSLLAAILGEMLQSKEGVIVRNKFDHHGNSRFSFASQLPWLEAGKSVRDNVIFGTEFDKERYDMCIHSCALQDDLDSMQDGDLTRIGSHTVSGGQKARISLARALYARSDTVLLDDVLSAVDTRVQNHLVKHAILGPISKDRRIVLVTHHVHLLVDHAALMVSMHDGRIVHQGEPAELQAQGDPATYAKHRSHTRGLQETTKPQERDNGALQPQADPVESSSKANEPGRQSTSMSQPATELASGARTPRLLHEEEKRREGAVSWIFYRTYLRASSLRIWGFLVLLLLLLRTSESFGQYWLKVWGEAYEKYGLQAFVAATASHLPFNLPPADTHAGFYLTVYGLSGFAVILFNSSRAVCFYIASIRASQNLFATLLANVIRAPLRWFDITPAGRIMNRFGTDMDCIDNILPQSIMNLGNNAFSMAAYFLICVAIVPAFILPTFLLIVLGPWLVGGFLACTRDMQRIEATSTSPIYGHFQQALSGIVTIRAFGAEPRLLESMLDAVDLYQSLWWAVCTMEVWLSFRSQILGGVSVFVVTLLALSGAVTPGSAGLALSSAQLLCQLAYYLVNDFKNLANSFNSLERVSEYQQMPREENETITAGYSTSLLPAAWPSTTARIVFDNVSLRYAEDLPTVLKGVSFDVKPGEKVGIIGRTGSGKSSLASSLFRAVELSGGRILIEDIDIKTIPLQQLRSRLSIVMQDPVLFSGTVRDNLDPFGEHEDSEVLRALRKVGLASPPSREDEGHLIDLSDPAVVEDTPIRGTGSMRLTLDAPVSSGGANFSAGQAQLLSLARSLLRSTRILILDEATSSTDMDTDAMVQRVIRTALKRSIVICIAHRLRSVIDYDRVVVMQDGKVVEMGTPKELLEKDGEGAYFKTMCMHSAEYAELCASAGVQP